MQNTEKALLYLIAVGLGKTDFDLADFPCQLDYVKLYRLSVEQGVNAVAVDGLQKILQKYPNDKRFAVKDVSDRMQRMQWIAQSVVLEKQYLCCEKAISDLAAFYNQNDIRMMILKGYGLSLDWPIPSHRPMGDLDTYNFGKQELADELVKTKLGIKVDDSYEHHTIFTYKGLMVENHYDFFNVYAHKSSKILDGILKKMVDINVRTYNVLHSIIYLPPIQFNALFLLRHAGLHFAGEHLVLRQVIDWAMFVDKHHEEIDWEDLENTAKKMNLDRFLACLNTICIENIGIDKAKYPVVEIDKELKERVLSDILSPEFNDQKPKSFFPILLYKWKRWRANAWKHRMVFNESQISMFCTLLYSHIKRIKTIKA